MCLKCFAAILLQTGLSEIRDQFRLKTKSTEWLISPESKNLNLGFEFSFAPCMDLEWDFFQKSKHVI